MIKALLGFAWQKLKNNTENPNINIYLSIIDK